jgi:hypothetical protein
VVTVDVKKLLRTVGSWIKWVIAGLFDLGEEFLGWLAKHSEPRYVARACIGFILVMALWTYFANKTWLDRINVMGVVVTLAGFTYTLFELHRAKGAAEEARHAWRQAAGEQSAEHYRYCLENAKGWLAEIKLHVIHRQWSRARFRLEDLAKQLTHIQSIRRHANERWLGFARNCSEWTEVFRKGKPGNNLDYNFSEWDNVTHFLFVALESELSPLTFYRGEDVAS